MYFANLFSLIQRKLSLESLFHLTRLTCLTKLRIGQSLLDSATLSTIARIEYPYGPDKKEDVFEFSLEF